MSVIKTGQRAIHRLWVRTIARPATNSNAPLRYTRCADVLVKMSALIDSVRVTAIRLGPSNAARCFDCATRCSFLRPQRTRSRERYESHESTLSHRLGLSIDPVKGRTDMGENCGGPSASFLRPYQDKSRRESTAGLGYQSSRSYQVGNSECPRFFSQTRCPANSLSRPC